MPQTSASDAIVLQGIRKSFGDFVAVHDISLTVPRGTIYGFLGPNGAGKTTTIRMMMSIFYPDAGSISILGEPNSERIKDRLGYLPEEKGLYKNMTAVDLITYFGRLKGLAKKDARARAVALMTKYGLGEWITTKCKALSKGMGQKVQILATLIHNPELVILDEPFSGLDPVNVETVREAILTLKREGKTVVFSTHVMEQAEQICDAVVLINRGRVLIDGRISDVRHSGGRTVHLDYEGDGTVLRALAGVERVNDAGKHAEFVLKEGTDADDLLKQIVGRVRVRSFDTREASLHEIFVRAVGQDSATRGVTNA
ncbi:MAG: ATP-binding cassette domain-containing protein [Gemmatimonadaceae bacterium]